MPIDNWMEATRDALWDALSADPDFDALTQGGTRFKFSKGILSRIEIEPAWCPIVSLGAASADLPPVESPQMEEPPTFFRINAQLVTAGPELAACEELLLALHAALLADWTRLAALYSDRLVRIRMEDVTFELWPTKDAARPLWNCELVLKCEFEPSA
jgi:hypothetical protein